MYVHTSEEKIAKCFIESKTRGRPQDASTHESLSGANKRTATEVVIGAL